MTKDKRKNPVRRHRAAAGHSEASLHKSGASILLLKRVVLPAIVFLWPFVYFFRHIIPIDQTYTALGNDFISLYYRYKLYLLASMAQFHFPLWSPSEAAGFPFYTNPFAQEFYPFNILLVLWYKAFGGYSSLDHQLYTVFGISIFGLGLYMWLRKVNANARAVLFAVLVMSVSFKTSEIMRFPNAVHTAAWYPWILYGITSVMLSRSLRAAAGYGFLLLLFLLCFWTGSYPYYIYYSQFLFMPYFLIFLIRPLRTCLIGTRPIHWKPAIMTLVIAGVIWVAICGPHIIGVKQLMAETTDRGGQNFEYSTEHEFTFEDTIGSLMYPPAAMEDGWNFFSITGLLIVLLYMVGGRTVGKSIEETGNGEKPTSISETHNAFWAKIFFVIWISMIVYISYGKHSYLFILLWKYMPGFSSLRIWARINIILVPILAWLLSLAYASFESLISGKTAAVGKQSKALPLIVSLAVVYPVILGTQLYLYLNNIYDPYWLEYFKQLTPQRAKFIVYGIVGFTGICACVILSKRIRLESSRSLSVMFLVLFGIAVIEMRPVGTHMWTHSATYQPGRFMLDMSSMNTASFRYPRIDSSFTIALSPVFSAGIIDNWYFNRYVVFLKSHRNEPEALKVLLGVADARRVFFSESIEHPTITEFLADEERFRDAGHLLSYTGEKLNWEINAPAAGHLSFIDNWDYGWKVYVDGNPAKMELLFGTFKSVKILAGSHRVQFVYRPGLCVFTKKSDFDPDK
jgi:hypothetical protein